jgi:hypothetical protein
VFFICCIFVGGAGQVCCGDCARGCRADVLTSLKVEVEMEDGSASGFEMLQTFDNMNAATTMRNTTEL